MLDRFIVTSDHDNKLLRQIRQQAGCNQDCGIFQIHVNSTKERFNVPSPPSVDGIETVASVLSVDSSMVVRDCSNCDFVGTEIVHLNSVCLRFLPFDLVQLPCRQC